MKSKSHRLLFSLCLTFVWAILPSAQIVSFAQATEPKPEVSPAVPALAEPPPSADKSPNPALVAPAEASAELAKPAGDKAAVVESKNDENASAEGVDEPAAEPVKPATLDKKEHSHRPSHGGKNGRRSDNARVSILNDSKLAAGENVDAVVSILGSSTSAGKVNDMVLSIFGSSTSSGEVGDAVVSVIGSTRVTDGTVGGAAVAILGSNYINSHVKGEVVAIFGNVELGPKAVVDGELVCVGGEVRRDPKAVVNGEVQNIAVGGFEWFTAWVTECLLYGRPLAFGPHLMWAWWIALTYLGVYALLALVAPGAVEKCVLTLEERPGKSILAAVLTLLLTPMAYLLLVLTLAIVIGIVLIPIFSLGLFFAGIFGKVVMLAWLGRRITKLVNAEAKTPAVITVLVGGVLVLGLYTVPVLGFVVYKLLGVLGLGVVVYTLLLSIQSRPPASSRRVVGSGASSVGAIVPPLLNESVGDSPITPLPPVISASTLERAGFWLRVGAALLDVVLVGILFLMLRSLWHGFGGVFPLWFAVYNVVMWATKSTTIGGIICGLKVVRLDDRPVDWGMAIVRGLSAFLSLAMFGLGFIWVAFDDEKQSWHDKIAGTTIVRVPKGTSLV